MLNYTKPVGNLLCVSSLIRNLFWFNLYMKQFKKCRRNFNKLYMQFFVLNLFKADVPIVY